MPDFPWSSRTLPTSRVSWCSHHCCRQGIRDGKLKRGPMYSSEEQSLSLDFKDEIIKLLENLGKDQEKSYDFADWY